MNEKVGRLKPDSVNDQIRVIVDGQGYVVVAEQVRNMLEKWPRKKATVFQVVK